ncbi:MAG TPA: SDR family oxidoreductase [Bryobacteraceae bacterium]|nr:SDR family oxidoreductase [Bryobacteraceae bacterium]
MTSLITGAGRGIGKRLAIGFAKAGIRVGLIGRSQGELDVTKLEIEHGGGSAHRFRADVRDFEQVSAAVGRMTDISGEVDVLVANAAILGPIGPFAAHRPRDWKEVFETNVIGVMNACRAVLPQMIQRRSGKILVIADSSSSIPRPNFAPYSASKAAVVRFVESVAEEVRDHNVQINCFSPGGAYTTMTDEILEAEDRVGSREVEEAEEIRLTGGVPAEKQIQIALFLASERSNHLTGKLIDIADDWKRLERENTRPDAWTLRRHLK